MNSLQAYSEPNGSLFDAGSNVLGAFRSDTPGNARASVARSCHGERARRAGEDLAPRAVEARAHPGGGEPRDFGEEGVNAPGPVGAGAARGGDRVDRALPLPVGAATRPPRGGHREEE